MSSCTFAIILGSSSRIGPSAFPAASSSVFDTDDIAVSAAFHAEPAPARTIDETTFFTVASTIDFIGLSGMEAYLLEVVAEVVV